MAASAALLARLRAVRGTYGADAEREKLRLLAALDALRLSTWKQLAALHEDLLFLRAFSGGAPVRSRAIRMLRAIGARVRQLPRDHRVRADDSGIAGSTTRHVFPFAVAHWLAREAPGDAEVDWRNLDDPACLDPFVSALAAGAEGEAFDGGDFGTREWIALARRSGARSDLQWLTESAAATPARLAQAAAAWDAADVPVAWQLRDSRWSVTHNALAGVAPVYRTSLRRPAADVAADVVRPLASIERLPRTRARQVAAAARAALAVRCREVNAMTHPNLDEIWWCDLSEGAALAVIGIARERRLTLETNTGYLLFCNGVPVGYGGVTPLYRQANTGINVFDPFRGAEAAFLWTQMLRAFHTLYGSRRFIVNPYQFGAGNAEAIASGAFWFYYRLGFRPALAATRTLAAREAQRMAGDRAYRSDAKTLKALANGDLRFDLPGFDEGDHFDEALLPRAGALAARTIAREATWSRAGAVKRIAQRLAADLGIDDFARWSSQERRGFEFLAPVVAGVPGIRDWSPADRAAAAAMLRAKAAPQERGFALKALRAPGFFRELRHALARMR